MILLVDAGNSKVKWALALDSRGGENCGPGDAPALRAHGELTHGELAHGALARCWSSLGPVQRVVGCTVAGATVAQAVASVARDTWGHAVEWTASHARGWGVRNAYPVPSALGADRWAALVAAYRYHPAPACVVDCGTAMTVDALAADGAHLGGLIAPGVGLMRHALERDTAALPGALGDSPSLLASNTEEAIMSGTAHAGAALVERVLAHVAEQAGTEVLCIVTGGDTECVASRLHTPCVRAPDLVLQGLMVMAGERQ